LQWKFSLGSNNFIARLPPQEMGHGRNAGACPGCERDFFRLRARDFREGGPNSDWSLEKDAVVNMMRKLVGFNCGFDRMQGHTGDGRMGCRVQVGCVCNLKPPFPPVGRRLHCGHEISFPVTLYEPHRSSFRLFDESWRFLRSACALAKAIHLRHEDTPFESSA
jgi:hypothetical protein